jgi:uncharacterized protein YceH (UPF0502 family)
MTLDPIQLRVLGALIEKEITTPENYPLSLNSLISACNQRSSRDPVLDLTEDEVRQAVHSLEDSGVVSPVRDSRVPKYEHRIRTVLNLRRDETAILCLLLLRGPQTPGELRGRADRMYSFDDIGSVQSTLERMASRGSAVTSDAPHDTPNDQATPLVVQLARQPGSRESRYAHLLGGPVAAAQQEPVRSRATTAEAPALTNLKSELRSDLISEVESALQAKFEDRLVELSNRIAALEARLDRLEVGANIPVQVPSTYEKQ